MVDAPVFYLQAPADIVNQALDLIGADEDAILGDVNDGTRVGETARRHYGQTLRQMLRANHWPFARKEAPLLLLGDATGNSAPPVSTFVESGWIYAFAWPLDGVQGRWMPFSPGSNIPTNNQGVPLTTGPTLSTGYPLTPARFLVSSSDQYPIENGVQPWNQLPDLRHTEGVGPTSRKIVLTNCSPCARLVYTRLVTVIEEWDDGFRNAMVTAMALVLAPVAIDDPKRAIMERDRLIPILKNTLDNARAQASNEAAFPQTIDREASYIRARNWGSWGGRGVGNGVGFGWGADGLGYDSCSWSPFSCGGSVF